MTPLQDARRRVRAVRPRPGHHVVTNVAGGAIGGVVALLARVRSVDKPMHPRGEVGTATLRRQGSTSGAAFLDDVGVDDVVVRSSRSIGLRAPYPDVNGLAVRVSTAQGGHADVLLSGTGRGPLSRYLLLPSTRRRGPFVSSLLPYRAPSGPVHLGASTRDGERWELWWSRPLRGWTRFAVLELHPDDDPQDRPISFDAVVGGPDGLEVYGWHRRLREPSYRAARRSRAAD